MIYSPEIANPTSAVASAQVKPEQRCLQAMACGNVESRNGEGEASLQSPAVQTVHPYALQ